MFNSAIGKQKLFNINTFTSVSYQNAVGYVSTKPNDLAVTEQTYEGYSKVFEQAASQKNTTKTLGVDENLNLSYRSTWFDVGLLGKLNYQHARARCSKMPIWTLGTLLMVPMPMSTSALG